MNPNYQSYEPGLILTSLLLEAVLRVGVCEGALFEKAAPLGVKLLTLKVLTKIS